jgi:hypothetical protein
LTLLLSAILYFALGAVTAVPVITLIRIGLGTELTLDGIRDTKKIRDKKNWPKNVFFPLGFSRKFLHNYPSPIHVPHSPLLVGLKVKKRYPCNRPWRPLGL